jgi:hypothetical protein
MMEETTGDWRGLHKEELHDLYYSPNIILVIKSGGGGESGGACCMYGGEGFGGETWRKDITWKT